VDGKSKYFASLFPKSVGSDIVFRSKDFFLVPDIVPVGLGHALIVSKQHTGNLLSVWNGEDASAASLIRQYREWSRSKGFEFMIAFEHGLGSIGREKPHALIMHIFTCCLLHRMLVIFAMKTG
jgi:hypothetical protein